MASKLIRAGDHNLIPVTLPEVVRMKAYSDVYAGQSASLAATAQAETLKAASAASAAATAGHRREVTHGPTRMSPEALANQPAKGQQFEKGKRLTNADANKQK